ncbi:helical backbone metal receptor, partial [Vibrio parahaemolyticus]|nr:helical backbone metal receptor [Vibrio parahaemolyticus]
MNKICLYLPLFFSSLTMANDPVERVISLAPHATEIAYAAGLGDKLIAVSEMSDYPKEAGELEKVSNYQGIKLERIIALQPDLVIAWPAGNPAKELEKLKQFGVPIYYSTTGT